MAKRIKGSNVQAVITDGKVTGLAVNGQDIGVVTAKTSGAGLVGFGLVDSAADPALANLMQPRGVSVLFLGASITDGANSSNASTTSYAARLGRSMIAGRKVWGFIKRGFPSQNSTYIVAQLEGLLDLHRPRLVLMGPDFGTNSIEQSISLSVFQADVEAARLLCVKRNVPIEFCKVLPRSSAASAAKHSAIGAYNEWLSFYCAVHGIRLHDTFSALADPTTGYLSATYDTDGIHPNTAGHQLISDTISPNCMTNLPLLPWPVSGFGGGLVPDGKEVMTTSLTNVTGTAAATLTLEAPSTGIELPAGQWQAASMSAAGFRVICVGLGNVGAGGFDVGDKLLICGYFSVTCSDGTDSTFNLFKSISTNLVTLLTYDLETPKAVMETYVVKDTDPSLYVGMTSFCGAAATTKARVGAMGVYNLTKMGIADLFG